MHRYLVYFQVDKDIDISVLVESFEIDEDIIVEEARNKLDKSPLYIVDIKGKSVVELLETIE